MLNNQRVYLPELAEEIREGLDALFPRLQVNVYFNDDKPETRFVELIHETLHVLLDPRRYYELDATCSGVLAQSMNTENLIWMPLHPKEKEVMI
jgi:hypothetical protein